MPNILLVEDDDALSEGIALALRAAAPPWQKPARRWGAPGLT